MLLVVVAGMLMMAVVVVAGTDELVVNVEGCLEEGDAITVVGIEAPVSEGFRRDRTEEVVGPDLLEVDEAGMVEVEVDLEEAEVTEDEFLEELPVREEEEDFLF